VSAGFRNRILTLSRCKGARGEANSNLAAEGLGFVPLAGTRQRIYVGLCVEVCFSHN